MSKKRKQYYHLLQQLREQLMKERGEAQRRYGVVEEQALARQQALEAEARERQQRFAEDLMRLREVR